MAAFIRERSALYHLYRTIRGNYNAYFVHKITRFRVDTATLEWTDRPIIEDHEELMKSQLRRHVHRLRILSMKVIERGARPIFVTQGSRGYKKSKTGILGVQRHGRFRGKVINGVDYYLMIRLIHEKTLEVCGELQDICIDLADELEFNDEDFYDFVHNTPKGAEKIGHYLYGKLHHLF